MRTRRCTRAPNSQESWIEQRGLSGSLYSPRALSLPSPFPNVFPASFCNLLFLRDLISFFIPLRRPLHPEHGIQGPLLPLSKRAEVSRQRISASVCALHLVFVSQTSGIRGSGLVRSSRAHGFWALPAQLLPTIILRSMDGAIMQVLTINALLSTAFVLAILVLAATKFEYRSAPRSSTTKGSARTRMTDWQYRGSTSVAITALIAVAVTWAQCTSLATCV